MVTLALTATVTAAGAAQTPTPSPAPLRQADQPKQDSVHGRLDRLLQGITLTPEQRARIDSIHARHLAMVPVLPPGGQPDSTARAQMHRHMELAEAEIRALLTAEQRQVWDRNVAAARAAPPQAGQSRP
jgi:Spy/CpxP family protein refolding chaperone